MTTLYIYGDESGTMPTKDNDKPFVTATVAFFEKSPHAIPGSDEERKLVEILRQSNAIPFLATVKPFPGYGNSLEFKYDKMQIMARAKCLLDDSTVPNLDKGGFNLRNQVWGHAMLQSILHVVRCAMYSGSIDSVRILLDKKTMTKPRRNHFTQMIYRWLGGGTVHWSDEADGFRSEFGLKLADRLARMMYRQLLSTSQTGIEHCLRNAGFEDFLYDITQIITRPLSQRAIDAWKQDTGLPEPKM